MTRDNWKDILSMLICKLVTETEIETEDYKRLEKRIQWIRENRL